MVTADSTGMDTTTDAHLAALADTVWAERDLVEHLLYKLTSAKLVLAADLRRFVPRALDEVEVVVRRLATAEQRRSVVLDDLCHAWGEPAGSLTLATIAERAPEPWATMFADHHARFSVLALEVEATADENRRLASASLQHVQDQLATVTGTPAPTYSAAGLAQPVTGATAPAAARYDRVM